MKVKLGDLPKPVKQIAFALLKLSNPPFSITDDLELEVEGVWYDYLAKEYMGYIVKAGVLQYGVCYREESYECRYSEIYDWTSTPILIENFKTASCFVQGNIARAIYLLLTADEITDEILRDAYETVLKNMKEELEEFLKQKLPEWMKGYEFYDIETKKMQKITEIHFIKVSFMIVDGVVEVVFDQYMYYIAKVGDKFAGIWCMDGNKYVEIETEFKGIPIKVRIYGDEGATHDPEDYDPYYHPLYSEGD